MADDKENTPPDLGGLQIPSGASENSSGNTAISGSASSSEIEKRRKPRSDAGKPRGTRSGNTQPSVLPLSPELYAKLYSPDLWGKVLSAPADAAAFATGSKVWEVPDKERELMGSSGAIAAQCFAQSDPRWLALALCAITVIDVYGVRLALYMAEKKEERRRNPEKKT